MPPEKRFLISHRSKGLPCLFLCLSITTAQATDVWGKAVLAKAEAVNAGTVTSGTTTKISLKGADEVFPGAEWQRSTPSEVGMKDDILASFVAKASYNRDPHYLGAIIRYGRMVESWGDIAKHDGWASAWKIQNGLCLMLLVQEGLLTGIDAPIEPWVPLAFPGKSLIEKDRGITFAHLADQVSGYGYVNLPGQSFAYNDAATDMARTLLNAVVTNRYPTLNWNTYLVQRLGVLGLQDGLTTFPSVRDYCRIGLLAMHQGRWAEQELIAPALYEKCVQPRVGRDLPLSGPKHPAGLYLIGGNIGGYQAQGVYGFWWWFNQRPLNDPIFKSGRIVPFFEGLPSDAYAAFGYGNNFLIVMPRLRMVAAFNSYSGNYTDWNLLMDALIDCDRTPPSLPAAPTVQALGPQQVQVNWPACTDTDGRVDAYWVYRDGARVSEVTTNAWIDPAAQPGQIHTYQVQAFNGSGFASEVGPATQVTMPSPLPPALSARQMNGDIVLFWPTNATGFVLEHAPSLQSSNWSPVATTPTIVGDQNTVTNTMTGDAGFYRLHKSESPKTKP